MSMCGLRSETVISEKPQRSPATSSVCDCVPSADVSFSSVMRGARVSPHASPHAL